VTSDPGTEDPTPLTRLIGTIASRGVDAVAFTSAAATTNLLRVAERGNRTEMLRALASDVLVACVGPVTAARSPPGASRWCNRSGFGSAPW
jgi:uroporphyrinogen-III synthase